MSTLKGTVGFKGNDGDSAYIVAVKNGYEGTEQDWLATLGTAQHYDRVLTTFTATSALTYNLSSQLTSSSLVDVFVNGLRKASNTYTIDTTAKTITFASALTSGATVEVYMTKMSTSALPIVTTINAASTNDTAPGTKAVYDLVHPIEEDVSDLEGDVTSLNTSVTNLNTTVATKLAKADIQVLTGSVSSIAAGATAQTDINYPTGFTQANTVIIGKMVSSNNNYYDTANEENTASGFPIIKMIALNTTGIRLWLKNNSSSQTRTGYYKITLLKIS